MAALSTVGRNRSTLLSDSRKRCVANDSDIYSILDSLQGSARRLGNEGELGLNSGKSWSYMDRGGIGQQENTVIYCSKGFLPRSLHSTTRR